MLHDDEEIEEYEDCKRCKGTGFIYRIYEDWDAKNCIEWIDSQKEICSECKGKGIKI